MLASHTCCLAPSHCLAPRLCLLPFPSADPSLYLPSHISAPSHTSLAHGLCRAPRPCRRSIPGLNAPRLYVLLDRDTPRLRFSHCLRLAFKLFHAPYFRFVPRLSLKTLASTAPHLCLGQALVSIFLAHRLSCMPLAGPSPVRPLVYLSPCFCPDHQFCLAPRVCLALRLCLAHRLSCMLPASCCCPFLPLPFASDHDAPVPGPRLCLPLLSVTFSTSSRLCLTHHLYPALRSCRPAAPHIYYPSLSRMLPFIRAASALTYVTPCLWTLLPVPFALLQ